MIRSSKVRMAMRVTLVALLVALSPLPRLSECASAERDASDVVEAICLLSADAIDRVDAIDERVTIKQEPIDGTPNGNGVVPLMSIRLIVDWKTQRYHYWSNIAHGAADGRPAAVEFAYEDGTETTYSKALRQGSIVQREKAQEDPRTREWVLRTAFMFKPAAGGAGIDDNNLPNLLRDAELRPTREAVDGHECHVIDAWYRRLGSKRLKVATIWVDLARGALPRKSVVYGHGNDNSELRILDAHEFPDGRGGTVWLPTTSELLTTVVGRRYKISVEARPDEITVNPTLAPTAFRVEFPDGIVVNDVAQGNVFQTPGTFEGEEPGPASLLPRGRPLILFCFLMLIPLAILLALRVRAASAAGRVSRETRDADRPFS